MQPIYKVQRFSVNMVLVERCCSNCILRSNLRSALISLLPYRTGLSRLAWRMSLPLATTNNRDDGGGAVRGEGDGVKLTR